MTLEETIAAVIVGEIRVIPFMIGFFLIGLLFSAQKTDWKSLRVNLSYWPFWVIGNMAIAAVLHVLCMDDLREWSQRHVWVASIGQIHPALLSLINLATFDFFYYWYHRTEHVTSLWHYHAVHHSDTAMNPTTAFRHHFFENVIRVPIVDLPLMLIFIDATANPNVGVMGMILTAFISYLGVFAHSNLRIGFGPLAWLIINPQIHRVHHSLELRHADKNFAAYFPILDVIFGTYYHPARNEYPETGVVDIGRTLDSPIKMMVHPFKRWWPSRKTDASVGPA